MKSDDPGEASPVRARIVDAALKRFEQFGFRRTGMAEIARDVGVAPGTLYRYFESKQDLFLTVVRTENRRWIERARAALAEPGTVMERLARLGAASVERYREHSLAASILQRDAEIIFAPLIDELYEEIMDETVGPMAAVIRQGIESGEAREVDPEKTAFIYFLAGQALFNQTRYPYQEILPLLVDLGLASIAKGH